MSTDLPTYGDVEDALTEAALRDLGRILGPEQARRLYLTDTGFHFAVDGLVRTGWWPHSMDIESYHRAKDDAHYAASVIMGTMHHANALRTLGELP